MSYGKYSPVRNPSSDFIYNAYGQVAPDWIPGTDEKYDEKIHFGNYDSKGYDSYGYSAWNADGSYAGIGEGIDSAGYNETEYLNMYTDELTLRN